jgi:hypothetical protein
MPVKHWHNIRWLASDLKVIRLTRNKDRQQQMSLRTASFLAGLAGFVPLIDVGYAIRRFCRLPLDRARKLGLEGVIGKRCGSRYEAGKRDGAWIKVQAPSGARIRNWRVHREGSRKYFGALLVGRQLPAASPEL